MSEYEELKNKKIQTVIHNFYKKERIESHFYDVDLLDNTECRYFIYKLKQELAIKDSFKEIDKNEKVLLLVLLNDVEKQKDNDVMYSLDLVNAFKDILKAVKK